MTSDCPHCGAPSPLDLSSPEDARCRSCGLVSPRPEGARAALHQARAVLGALHAKSRQLDGLARRSALNARHHYLVLIAATLIMGAPLVYCVGLTLANAFSDAAGLEYRLACALPIAVYAGVVALGAAWMARVRRRLIAACAARPPAVPGQPAECRVCGGDLSGGLSGVVRCSYCAADNLVSAEALHAAGARRSRDLEQLAQSIQHDGSVVGSVARQIVTTLALSLVAAPLASCVLTGCLAFTIGQVEGELDERARYAIVETPAGRCIAKVTIGGANAPVWLSFGGRAESGYLAGIALETTDGLEQRGPRELVGLRVRRHRAPRHEGTIVRAFGTRGGWNRVTLRTDAGREETTAPAGLCLRD